jgi:hypothetical protein
MRGMLCAATAAAIAFSATIDTADAAKKRAANARSSLATAKLECFKQNGGWYDEKAKRWVMQAPYYIMASRIDAVNACITQRTGKTGPFMNERIIRP